MEKMFNASSFNFDDENEQMFNANSFKFDDESSLPEVESETEENPSYVIEPKIKKPELKKPERTGGTVDLWGTKALEGVPIFAGEEPENTLGLPQVDMFQAMRELDKKAEAEKISEHFAKEHEKSHAEMVKKMKQVDIDRKAKRDEKLKKWQDAHPYSAVKPFNLDDAMEDTFAPKVDYDKIEKFNINDHIATDGDDVNNLTATYENLIVGDDDLASEEVRNTDTRKELGINERMALMWQSKTGEKGEADRQWAATLTPFIGQIFGEHEAGKMNEMYNILTSKSVDSYIASLDEKLNNAPKAFDDNTVSHIDRSKLSEDKKLKLIANEASNLIGKTIEKRKESESQEDYLNRIKWETFYTFAEKLSNKAKADEELYNAKEDVFSKMGLPAIESARYMGELAIGSALTGGVGGVGSLAGSSAAKAGVSQILKRALGKAATYVTKTVAKDLPTTFVQTMPESMRRSRDDYSIGEDGQLEIAKGDDGLVYLESLGNQVASNFLERGMDALTGKLVGKGARALSKASRKLGQTVGSIVKNYQKLSEYTGLGDMVLSELPQENVQYFFNDVLGWGKKDSEYNGFLNEWNAAWSDGGMYTAKGQWDTLLGMILVAGGQAALGGIGAGVKAHNANKSAVDYLREIGFTNEQIKNVTPAQKKAIDRFHRDFAGKNDAIVEAVSRFDKFLGEEVAKQIQTTTGNLEKTIAEHGEKPQGFTYQTETDMSGKLQPKFTDSIVVGADGENHLRREMRDDASGVSFFDDGVVDGKQKYTIVNNLRPDEVFETNDFKEAAQYANTMALSNQKRGLDNALKEEYARGALVNKENAPFTHFTATVRNAYDMFSEAINKGKPIYGVTDLSEVFVTDKDGNLTQPPQLKGDVNNRVIECPDGTLIPILDNIGTVEEMNEVLGLTEKKEETTNETRTDEAQQKPEQAQSVTPPAGEEARPMEIGEAPSEVGREVGTTQPTAEAPTSASTPTQANTTPPVTAESAEGGSQAADAVSAPTPTTPNSANTPLNPEASEADKLLAAEDESIRNNETLLKLRDRYNRLKAPKKKNFQLNDIKRKIEILKQEQAKAAEAAAAQPTTPTTEEAQPTIPAPETTTQQEEETEVLPSFMEEEESTPIPEESNAQVPIDNTPQTNYNATQTVAEGINNEEQQTKESLESPEDEFRRLQETSRGMSENERELYRRGSKVLDERDLGRANGGRGKGRRGRIVDVLRRRIAASNNGANLSGVRTLTSKEKDGTVSEKFKFGQVDGQTFRDVFEVVRNYLKNGELVDLHDTYGDDVKCFLSEDGLCGFAVEADGNLVSVFSLRKGSLNAMKGMIKKAGATHLDAYASKNQDLDKIYSKVLGFKVASRMDYNMDYDHDNIAANHDNPDVVFMYLPQTEKALPERRFNKDSYDAAVAYQKRLKDTKLKKGGQKKSESQKLADSIKRNVAKAKVVYDKVRVNDPNAKLDPFKFRKSQGNNNGLKLSELKELSENVGKEEFVELGLTEQQAEELVNTITDAYIEQELASSNVDAKSEHKGKVTYAVGAMQALDNLRKKPDDINILAQAIKRVTDASDVASRTFESTSKESKKYEKAKRDNEFWNRELVRIFEVFNTLEPHKQKQVNNIIRSLNKKRDAADNKNTSSLNAGVEGGNIDIADTNASTPDDIDSNEEAYDEVVSDFGNQVMEDSFEETGDYSAGTQQGSDVDDIGDNKVINTNSKVQRGEHYTRVDKVDGDNITVTTTDLRGKNAHTMILSRADWERVAKMDLDKAENADLDPKNPQVGDMILLATANTETKEERDKRFAQDKNYQTWLKRQKANDSERMRERYEQEGAKVAANLGRNFIGGVKKVKVVDRLYIPAIDGGDIQNIRNPKTQQVVGTWNRKTQELTLFHGANASTLVHELGGHAAYQFAQEQAAKGDKTLLNKMNECIDYALTNPKMKSLVDDIRSRYPEATEEVMRDEIFAALMERNSPIMQNLTKTLQGKAWYNRAWQAIKEAFKSMLTKMGLNKADMRGIDKMQPEEFMSWLDRTMAEGKNLGALEGMDLGDKGDSVRNALGPIKENEIAKRLAANAPEGGYNFSQFTKDVVVTLVKGGRVTKEIPGFENATLIIESPSARIGQRNIDYSALKHNWETGNPYSGAYTWEEFDEAFKDENLKKAVSYPDKDYRDQEDIVWTVNYPAKNGKPAYTLKWILQRKAASGKIVNLYTNRREGVQPILNKKSPEGEHSSPTPESVAGSSNPRNLDISSGDGDSITQSAPNDNGVRAATAPASAVARSSFMDDKQTKVEKLKEDYVDSTAPIERAQKEVDMVDKARGGTGVEEVVNPDGSTDWLNSTDYLNARDKENGHLERARRELETNFVKPMMETLAKAVNPNLKGKDARSELVDDFNIYLQCRHAEARNRKIANDHKETYTDDYYRGMGMITRADGTRVGLSKNEADRLLADMRAKYGAKFTYLEQAAQYVYDMLAEDLDNRYQAGLLSSDEYVKYLSRRGGVMDWGTYIPLKDDLANTFGEHYNSFSQKLKRNEFMKAKGRGEMDIADSPLAAAILQYEQGLNRASKNILANVEANLVAMMNGGFKKNGITDFSKTERVYVDPVTGDQSGAPIYAEVVEGVDERRGGTEYRFTFGDGKTFTATSGTPNVAGRSDIHLFKRDGKLYAIRYPVGANGLGRTIANAFSGDNISSWGDGMGSWIPRATRWLSAMRTQYSLEFMVTNMMTDNWEAFKGLVGKYGIVDGGKVFGRSVRNQVANSKDLWHYVSTGEARGVVKKAIDAGLLTKGGVASQGIEAETNQIKSDLAKFIRQQKKLMQMRPTDMAKSAWDNTVDFISIANSFAELSTRIGIFDALEHYNVPTKDAIKYARDATVNFNRKGAKMPIINGLYMFANASIQGLMRVLQALKDDWSAKPKTGLGSHRILPRGELTTMLVLIGVSKAVLDSALGGDEDDEKNAENQSEYERRSYLGIPIGGGKQLTLLRERGLYAAIPYLAQTFTRAALGKISMEDAAKIVVSELSTQLTEVVGGNGILDKNGKFDASLVAQSLSPTLGDPIVQYLTKKDFKGDNINRKSFDDKTVKAYNGKDSTSIAYKAIAKALNWATGGDKIDSGKINMSPEEVKLIVEFIGGGPFRDLINAGTTVSGGSDDWLKNVPVGRRLIRNYPDNTGRYYDATDSANVEKKIQQYREENRLEKRKELREKHPWLQYSGRIKDRIKLQKELLQLEKGRVKQGNKWVEPKQARSDEKKAEYKARRLKVQAEVLKLLGK